MPDGFGRPLVDAVPTLVLNKDGKLESAPGEKPLVLPPGQHDLIVAAKVDVPAPPLENPETLAPVLPGSKVQGITQKAPVTAPGPRTGFEADRPSPHTNQIGRLASVPPRSIFDFSRK
jgi:hypothetical protein